MDFFVSAKPKEGGVAAPTPTERGNAGAEKGKFIDACTIEFSIRSMNVM